MKYDIKEIANKYGYIKDNIEKVLRLNDILNIIFISTIKNILVLKGGTCINLYYRDIPRLSVDIDLDYIGEIDRERMLQDKIMIEAFLENRLEKEGYFLSNDKTRKSYALDSLVFKYTNNSGNIDNIKIEINYMDRLHLCSLIKKKCNNKILSENVDITILSETEIYACKIVALLNRSTPRDLFDIYMMIKDYDGCNIDEDLMRKAIIFYNSISGEINLLDSQVLTNINEISQNEVYKYLLPMLTKNEKLNLVEMKEKVINKLKEIIVFSDSENEFIKLFKKGIIESDKLFDDKNLQDIVKNHPMVEHRINHIKNIRK